MKSFNIFKKENKKAVKVTAQKLDKNQLEKVIGGDGDTLATEIPPRSVKVRVWL